MNKSYLAQASVSIDAPPAKVWDALTRPEMIKQYLFGTEVSTDWQVGSPITYRGTWEGKAYEDKGKILQIEPGKLLVSTFWSSLSGLPDLPENYNTVRYELAPEGNGTRLTLIQDNNPTQEDAGHSEQNWKMVLDGLKKLVES
ncbi:MAG: SRPBCC domain-containing protein [Chloroflexota bacterium]|nr:MAG: SRPBCC domain-containing protein [Chloroflexota bacterium]